MVTLTSLTSRFLPIPALLLLLPAVCAAETLTLTDKQDRSITVNVLSVDGDTAKIKRDDGRQFDLPLASLSETSRDALRDWAKREAEKPLPPNSIEVIAGRTKFDSDKTETRVPYNTINIDGTVDRGTRIRVKINEQWGYSLTVTNRTLAPIDGLRAEYKLFTEGVIEEAVVQKLSIPTLKAREQTVLKTSSVTFSKSHYRGESVKPVGGQLQGVWVRIYKGDTLVHESSTPEGIRLKQKW